MVAETAARESLERYVDLPPLSGVEGRVEELLHYASQSVGGVEEVTSAGTVVRELVEEATPRIDSFGSLRAGTDW